MDMIGHDNSRMKFELLTVLFQAAFENNVLGCRRKLPAVICRKGDEERMIVLLIVR